MASHFDPGDIQHFIEGLEGNDDSASWGDIINFSQEDTMGYLVDDATSFITGNQEPALTHGPTQASSHRPRSPSSDLIREDPGPYRHGFDATPHKEICENLSAPQVDFRGIGEAPEIYVEGQPPRPLDLTQEDDELHGSSLPTTRRRLGLPLVNASLSPSSISPGHSRPPSSTDHSVSPVSAPSMSRDGSNRSGRKNPLSEPQRVKAADMRKARACHRCRMLKVECDQGSPCERCVKAFPDHRGEVCDRVRMAEFLPDEGQPSVWNIDPTDLNLTGNNYFQCPAPVHITVNFDQDASNSPGLELMLQPYGVNTDWFPQAGRGHGQYYQPLFATSPATPITTAGGWPLSHPGLMDAATSFSTQPPWTNGGQQRSPSLGVHWRLYPSTESLTQRLRCWAESQIQFELVRQTTFEAAIVSFVFALRDRPLPLPPESTGRRRRGSSEPSISPRYLLRNVCEMTSWFRIWQARQLYFQRSSSGRNGTGGVSQLPVSVLSELKRIALAGLVSAERLVLEGLDSLLNSTIKGIEVPVLACLWQMILIYRQAIVMYSESMRGGGGGSGYIPVALNIISHLHRILLVKHGAYFRSSSPIFPKRGQPSTLELLEHPQLKRAWENVLERRGGFYHEVSSSMEPSDELLKVLIVDAEEDLERRRRRQRGPVRG